MMEKDAEVTDDDLHAFVDGQLDAERVPAVLRHLQTHPEAASRAASWQAQRLQMRRLYRETEPGPVPAALAAVVQRRARRERWRPWGQAVAAVLLFAAGAAGARLWPVGGTAPAIVTAGAPQFVRDAATAYAVFAPEVRHAVEVPAQEEAHLVQWLSRRLGRPLTAPVLQAQGYRLLGGRLLTGDGNDATAPRAQFMYEDGQGRRVTLYVAVFAPQSQPRETAFQSVRNGDAESFYWVENGYGYALSAALPAADVQALASVIYDQLYPR
ncbi:MULTISPECIES: anti-sigma factor [unclassified Achromobacter]|uniref:anti-sigma factor family protein n=1 Tax=unclassified Achromobacter TaxID=2626865 RepID=UPI001177A639|nr:MULTISPECIES: anti-sigma factor [unclassified Achromobacter]